MTINFFILIWVQMIFDYFCKKLISYDETQDVKKLREYFKDFMDCLLSFPLNIPGTAFHACLQVPYQKNILTYIEYFLKKYCTILYDHARYFRVFLLMYYAYLVHV